MYIRELSETRIQELETIFQQEISDYQNKVICKEKFIYLIKERCKIMEFCYLYNKYIGKIEVIGRFPSNINFEDYESLIETKDNTNINYNNKIRKKKHPKKLVKIENMSKKHYK